MQQKLKIKLDGHEKRQLAFNMHGTNNVYQGSKKKSKTAERHRRKKNKKEYLQAKK
jgi:hypothetical protein